jgi:hypothetical protein
VDGVRWSASKGASGALWKPKKPVDSVPAKNLLRAFLEGGRAAPKCCSISSIVARLAAPVLFDHGMLEPGTGRAQAEKETPSTSASPDPPSTGEYARR